MSPTLTVLGTWAALAIWVSLLGAVPGALAGRRTGLLASVRVAIWSGLAILILALLILNLFAPLVGTGPLVVMAGLTVTSVAVAAGVIVRAARPAPRGERGPFPWWTLVPIAVLGVLLIVLAHATFGTVGNFDSGLYHLNAITFAAEYPTIPGLGNLHDRYGTNVSAFNLAAFLGNLAWGSEAFRLMVGFVVALFALDVALRLVDRDQWRTPGLYVMALGAMLFAPFLVSDTAYWVTSPTADTTSMLVSIVSGAFLLDALWRRDSVSGAMAVVTAALAASMRAQLWVLAVVTGVVLISDALRVRRQTGAPRGRPRALTWIAAVLAGGLLVVQLVRDTLLSGWLLYPAGNLPMPVEWRTGDPQVARSWIQSWAKSPGTDPATTADNWDWLGNWLVRALDDWAVRGAIGLLALALVVGLTLRGRESSDHGAPSALYATILGVLPAVLTVVVWFVAAPDPRFAWGVIVLVGLVPAAMALVAIRREDFTAPVAVGFMTLTVLPAAMWGLASFGGSLAPNWELRTFTVGPLEVSGAVNPVPVPAVEDVVLDSGDIVQRPVEGDQCWTVFPLCRPTTETSLRFRGPSLRDGFISGS